MREELPWGTGNSCSAGEVAVAYLKREGSQTETGRIKQGKTCQTGKRTGRLDRRQNRDSSRTLNNSFQARGSGTLDLRSSRPRNDTPPLLGHTCIVEDSEVELQCTSRVLTSAGETQLRLRLPGRSTGLAFLSCQTDRSAACPARLHGVQVTWQDGTLRIL